MKIPTIFFINKIDQEGIDLPMVYREMKAKLSSEIIVKQKVGQHPHINVTDNDDMEQWDAVIMGKRLSESSLSVVHETVYGSVPVCHPLQKLIILLRLIRIKNGILPPKNPYGLAYL